MAVGYLGPERRRHRAYVTRNTEYHFRDDVCVAVRDVKSRKWLVSHLAVGFFYYAVLTPIGLLMRVVGYDPFAGNRRQGQGNRRMSGWL